MIRHSVQKICKSILDNVASYNVFCDNVRSSLQGAELRNNFYNERTVAHHFDVSLQKDLMSCYVISECAIPGNLVSNAHRSQLVDEVLCRDKAFIDFANRAPRCYIPDTVIIDRSGNNPVAFIEYKVDTKFTYYKLAIDYLKYKCYSSVMRCNSVFIYVLFYKSSDGIEIRGSRQIELKLELSKEKSFNGKSLFIFDKKIENALVDGFDIENDLAGLIGDADEVVEQIQMVSSGNEEAERVKNTFYYRLRNSFGPQVITAKRIVRNFRLLSEMDRNIRNNDYAVNDYFRDDYYHFDFNDYRKNDFSEYICKEVANHLHRQIEVILGDDKRSISEMYTLYNKRSLWILLMLRKFAIDMGWDDIADSFLFDVTGKTVDKYTELLNFAYANSLNAFRKLCLGLLYFINKLYPMIFGIEDGVIVSEKDFYLYDRYEQSLNRITKDIMKKIGVDQLRGFNVGKADDQVEFAKIILNL